jgi:hypothetical protein
MMATEKQLEAAILARRAAKGPRKKRTRPEPRQYTVADLERARDRVITESSAHRLPVTENGYEMKVAEGVSSQN